MKKKKYFIIISFSLVILLLAGCGSSNSPFQNYRITGTISPENNSLPIQGARVELSNSNGSEVTFTGYNGAYSFSYIERGFYTLYVEKEGYNDWEESIYVNGNENINIELSPILGDSTVTGYVDIYNNTEYTAASSSSKAEKEELRYIDYNKTDEVGEYENSEIIIKYKNTLSAQSVTGLENAKGLTELGSINLKSGRIFRYKLPEGKIVREMVDYYNSLEEVEYAEPNYIAYALVVPNDEYYDCQWGMVNANMEAAWDIRKYSSSVTVAVLDTGIILDHPDLEDNLVNGADFVNGGETYDPYNYQPTDFDPTDETTETNGGSHGTHVSGIIGAVGNNYSGIAGINWNLNLLPIRVLNENQSGTHFDIAEGIYYAEDRGADLINFSLGSSGGSYILEDAIDYADSSNIVMVAASGNDGSSGILYPAAYPETISVGATDNNNTRCSYSNYGSNLDLVAPGGTNSNCIASTWGYYNMGTTTSSYAYMSGTSMAASHVSGIAALLLAEGVNPLSIKNRLTSTAVDLGPSYYYGHGLVDAYGALLGKKLENPYVFAGNEDSNYIYVRSDTTIMNDNGSYTLNQVASEEVYIYGWRDVNDNGIIDDGDYFGKSDSELYITNNSYHYEDIEMYYVESSSYTSMEVQGMGGIH